MSVFDPHEGLVRNDATDTSRGAAEAITQISGRLALQAAFFFATRGEFGSTDDELEDATGMIHQTASARRNELARAKAITDTGRKRPTRSGKPAIVWAITPLGREMLAHHVLVHG